MSRFKDLYLEPEGDTLLLAWVSEMINIKGHDIRKSLRKQRLSPEEIDRVMDKIIVTQSEKIRQLSALYKAANDRAEGLGMVNKVTAVPVTPRA